MKSVDIKTGVIKPVECFKEGWQLIKNDYWILFAITIVGIMFGGVTLYILLGALVCGIFRCYLQVIDGGKAEFDGLFKSIKQNFGAGLLVMAIIVVPMIFVFSIMYLPILFSTMSGNVMTEDELFAWLTGALLIEFVIAIVMVCLHTLLMFAFPLIADKNLSGWEAIKTSSKAVWKNLNGVAGIWAVGFFVGLIGYLLLCIGIYFAIPIIIAGNTVAYRKVFPATEYLPTNQPPPPDAFENVGSHI
jgi:membrane-anchored glycerophosphoryl diester phosphodiesterase (GDPDase)